MGIRREEDKWRDFSKLVNAAWRDELFRLLGEQERRGADMARGLAALAKCKAALSDAESERAGLDTAKESVRSLEGILRRLRSVRNDFGLFLKYDYDEPMKPVLKRTAPVDTPHSSGLYDRADAAIAEALEDLSAATDQTRRSRPPHRPMEPHKAAALAELEAAGFGMKAREDLLRLISLKAPQPTD